MSRPDEDREPAIPDLEDLFVDRTAPPPLEDRVLSAVRASGWPAGHAVSAGRGAPQTRPGPTARAWMLRIAASLVLFLAGWGAGRSASTDPGPTHVLLLWEDETFTPEATPGAHAQAYVAWLQRVAEAGTEISGHELARPRIYAMPTPTDGGNPVRQSLPQDSARRGSGEPAGRVREARIGGFFLVRAESLQDAAGIAESSPHRRNGGWVEVAEIVER